MKIVYFDEEGITILVEMEKASIEQLAKSIDLNNKHESVVKELVKRFKALEERERDIRKKYYKLRSAASQARGALSFTNFI